MRKINYLIIVVFAILAALTSCNKNNDDGNNGNGNGNGNGNTEDSFIIDIKNVEGNCSEIAMVRGRYIPTFGVDRGEITASEFKNGECKLTLPEIVPNDFFGDGIYSGLPRLDFSSDKGAKLNSFEIFGYNGDEEKIGIFHHCCSVYYVYADKGFNVNGNDDYEEIIYNCTFKKGWNLLYVYYVEDLIITTQKPSSNNFKWHFGY